jgi:hypothetical protein
VQVPASPPPLLEPELLPELEPLLEPELLPELEPLLEPELLPELEPLLEPELLPELEPLLLPLASGPGLVPLLLLLQAPTVRAVRVARDKMEMAVKGMRRLMGGGRTALLRPSPAEMLNMLRQRDDAGRRGRRRCSHGPRQGTSALALPVTAT